MITNELISEIKSKINDNQKQAITGGILQGVLVDMVNGLTTTGLTFLGVLSPGDPAPSNEPTRGYYLSFQASTKDAPYFNGVHLHRYSMLIWTQDERGRWKFKRIKYEDHRGPKRIVVGRALPIHYNSDTKSFTIHLSGDGTRNIYAICGKQVLRGEDHGLLGYHLNNIYGTGRKSIHLYNYTFIHFREEDNGKTLNASELSTFISNREISPISNLCACSEAYKINPFGVILWCPKIQSRVTEMFRVIRDNTYRNMPDGEIANKWVVKKIPSRISTIKHYQYRDAEFRRVKRFKSFKVNGEDYLRAAGLSDNYLQIARNMGIR